MIEEQILTRQPDIKPAINWKISQNGSVAAPQAKKTKPRILFLFSDTGGGHRSSCEAIMEAIQLEFAGKVEMEMVDFLQDYYPWPYNKIPEIYRQITKFPAVYGKIWHFTDTPKRAKQVLDINRFNTRLVHQYEKMLAEHPADLVVSTHFLSIPPIQWMEKANRPETVVVVTDLVTAHTTWFNNCIDHYIVPTEATRNTALHLGVDSNKIDLLGLPVSNRFTLHSRSKTDLRLSLGWDPLKPVVLLLGGGEGMGAIEENAYAIAHSGLDLELAVITGRNKRLKAQLEAYRWPIKMHVYGFEHEMQKFMQSADILVTKAGPSSICEGLVTELPIILYDHLPGQEEGNVTYLVENHAGSYAADPELVVKTLQSWLMNSKKLAQMTANAKQLASPNAARQIARRLAKIAEFA